MITFKLIGQYSWFSFVGSNFSCRFGLNFRFRCLLLFSDCLYILYVFQCIFVMFGVVKLRFFCSIILEEVLCQMLISSLKLINKQITYNLSFLLSIIKVTYTLQNGVELHDFQDRNMLFEVNIKPRPKIRVVFKLNVKPVK